MPVADDAACLFLSDGDDKLDRLADLTLPPAALLPPPFGFPIRREMP